VAISSDATHVHSFKLIITFKIEKKCLNFVVFINNSRNIHKFTSLPVTDHHLLFLTQPDIGQYSD